MKRVMNTLPVLLFCSVFAALSVGCVERTVVDDESASSGDSQTADMVSSENSPNSAPSNLLAQKAPGSDCANCGPLPDPWTEGPLPDPWNGWQDKDSIPYDGTISPKTSKTESTSGSSSSGGGSHKD